MGGKWHFLTYFCTQVTKKENFLTKTIPNHLKMLDAFFNGKQFVAGHM